MGYDVESLLKNERGLKIKCECDTCGVIFFPIRNVVLKSYQKNRFTAFCSRECVNNFRYKDSSRIVLCVHCGSNIEKYISAIRENNFCNHSCAATHTNTHKTKGNRRSKLELWLEEQLTILYPTLLILYSDKTTIKSELDIYIPSLNLAFELNGIFHYEPIFGKDKLDQIQNNDNRKFQACLENQIQLCIIDTSQHKYVKPSTSQKYLDIIISIINKNSV